MRSSTIVAFVATFAVLASAQRMPFRGCTGSADYIISFRNFMRKGRFGPKVPELVFAPLAGISHSNRFSMFTVRGYANMEIAAIAKTGDVKPFLKFAKALKTRHSLVHSIANTSSLVFEGKTARIKLSVDCMHPFISVVSMIAPSPDWIVQINNMNLYDAKMKKFISTMSGNLIAYDAGVDSGTGFTDPADESLDIPTEPQQNIAPLSEDTMDPFRGRFVGRYVIRKL